MKAERKFFLRLNEKFRYRENSLSQLFFFALKEENGYLGIYGL